MTELIDTSRGRKFKRSDFTIHSLYKPSERFTETENMIEFIRKNKLLKYSNECGINRNIWGFFIKNKAHKKIRFGIAAVLKMYQYLVKNGYDGKEPEEKKLMKIRRVNSSGLFYLVDNFKINKDLL